MKEMKMLNLKNIKRTEDVICEGNISFHQLNLKSQILNGLLSNGFKYPSPIQIKAIPMGLLGLDLIVQAKSGTGKTCVFSVLALECVNVLSKVPQVLIISPTREIALQSLNVIKLLGRFIENLNCQLFIGGIKICEDLKNLRNCHIIVGTPGRIKHLIDEGHIQTDSIRLLVLDEADMLFTDNFQNAVNNIYNSLPMKKQMLTMSATYTEEMIEIIKTYMNSPVMIRLNYNEKAALLGIKHYYKEIDNSLTTQQIFWSKTDELLHILSCVDFQQCIVFSNYQSIANDLCEALESRGWSSAYISGNLDQKQRIDIYNKFKDFRCRVLITTDLTSRGIDVENVNLVINLGIPWDFETYLHRMGRAGRYGSNGVVISIVTKEEKLVLDTIQEKCCIHIHQLPDNIPYDFLENVADSCLENVIVEKLDKKKQSNNIKELFQIFAKYKRETLDIGSFITDFIDKEYDEAKLIKPPRFNEVMDQYYNSNEWENWFSYIPSNDKYFHSNLFHIIDSFVYKESEQMNDQKLSLEISQEDSEGAFDDSNEDLLNLEKELDRLSKWADHYSRKFQEIDEEIFIKTAQLNDLLLLVNGSNITL